jgi:hypothetical protein
MHKDIHTIHNRNNISNTTLLPCPTFTRSPPRTPTSSPRPASTITHVPWLRVFIETTIPVPPRPHPCRRRLQILTEGRDTSVTDPCIVRHHQSLAAASDPRPRHALHNSPLCILRTPHEWSSRNHHRSYRCTPKYSLPTHSGCNPQRASWGVPPFGVTKLWRSCSLPGTSIRRSLQGTGK